MRVIPTVLALLVLVGAHACTPVPEERPGMAYVPAGEFLMGSAPDDPLVYVWQIAAEQPQHPVRLDAFYVDIHEVTNAEFERRFPGHERPKRGSDPACDACPVTGVTWYEAQAYCAGQDPPKRLPTEAEWERAAKGGAEQPPEPFDEYAWYSANAPQGMQPVGTRKANGYGIHDVLGNAREWTADWYGETYYRKKVRDNPTGPAEGNRKVARGGAYFLPRRGVTATIRYSHPPESQLYFLGFRCVQDVEPRPPR